MNCPNCGGETYDNREAKAAGKYKPNAPDFSCKDKACGWKKWPEKKAAPKQQTAARPMADPWTWPELAEIYHESLTIARKQVVGLATAYKQPVVVAEILSAAATVFIAATRDGVAPRSIEPAPATGLNQRPKQLATGDADESEMPL